MRIFIKQCSMVVILVSLLSTLVSASLSCSLIPAYLSTESQPSNGGIVTPPEGSYKNGLEVVVTATAFAGYRFDRWEGDASGTEPDIRFIINGNKKVIAVFIKTYTLTVSTTPNGAGTVNPEGGVYDIGSEITLTAAPVTGWMLNRWGGDSSGVNNSVTVVMDSNKNITAYFERVRYTLTANVNPSGSGSINPAGSAYDSDDAVTLTATPANGWNFDHWGGDTSGANNPTTVVMSSNKNVTAYFTKVLTIANLPPTIGGATQSTELMSRSYSWNYQGEWSWEANFPVSLYEYYQKLPRPPTENYSVYVTHPSDDLYINQLVEEITQAVQQEGYSEYQTVEFAVAFIQSLPYAFDSVTTPYDEYPRYPIETLVDYGGDCEDTSILLASILDKMGYGVVLLGLPEHMAVGVKGDDNIYGSYWEYGGSKYYYIETTGENWGIGILPDEYVTAQAYIYPMIPIPILTHEWSMRGEGYIAVVDVKVSNLGTALAQNVTVFAGFDAGGGMVWNSKESEPFILGVDQQATVKLNLLIPSDKYTRLIVQILVNGIAVEESYSDWFGT